MKVEKYYSWIFFGGQLTEDHLRELQENMEKVSKEDGLEDISIIAITCPGFNKFNVILKGTKKIEQTPDLASYTIEHDPKHEISKTKSKNSK